MNDAQLLFTTILSFHMGIGILAYRQSREPVFLVLALAALTLWVWAVTLFN